MAVSDAWREVARQQAGLLSRAQLTEAGVSARAVEHRVRGERWQRVSGTVVATTTGVLSTEQRLWLGVLHGGPGALVAGVAAELAGLRNWTRDVVTVLVPYESRVPAHLAGFRFVRSRRDLGSMRARGGGPPRCRLEPAVLLFAAAETNPRTAAGILAAAVQQRRTTAEQLIDWVDRLAPLRGSRRLHATLVEIAGGSESAAELDVIRMCRSSGLAKPLRQVRRRDADGRVRYTDCEWRLADGRILMLEVDGAFHMDADQWEDDLARQRALAATDRLIVRCTSRELRDEPERVAAHLRMLGVPRAA